VPTSLNWNVNTTENPIIFVNAYAMQAETFANVNAAFAAFEGQWGNMVDAGTYEYQLPDEPAAENFQAEYNGVTYDTIYDAVAAANAAGGGTITLKGSGKLDKPVEIAADITIVGEKPNTTYTRADGYTGNMITVKAGATLNTEKLVLDGAGATATGYLVGAEANANIILNAGTVLKNNNGALAVNLGTRIGATLTLNGAEISNNSSDAGAIWGGGHITINEGSKINNNSSTGVAGAIRMVSNCNLTMNGGEICNNTAVTNGGAIYGYGVSTYNFKGGKMYGNSAAVGGAIYTGDSSVINISGDFEMTGNTAGNSGAIRFTNRTTLNMTGGKISGNTSTENDDYNGFYGWNVAANITGGELADEITLDSGLYCTVGGNGITGVVHFALNTNHNTALLAANFGTIKFTVAQGSNFSAFNLKPAAGYTYTAGDEAKLICMNEGYSTYWDAATGTFRLQAN
jgi:predicted outer membrane repeat protein